MPKRYIVRLSQEEQQYLKDLVSTGKTVAYRIKHANILLTIDVKQGTVAGISPRHVGRLLAEADLKPHQCQYWLDPPPTRSLMPRSQIFVKST